MSKKIGGHRPDEIHHLSAASVGHAVLQLSPRCSVQPGAPKRRGQARSVTLEKPDPTSADQVSHDDRFRLVGALNCDGHVSNVTRGNAAITGDDLQGTAALNDGVIPTIRAQWRQRQNWHRAEKSLTLQAKAMCRSLAHDGDLKESEKIYRAALGKGEHPMAFIARAATTPLIEARDSIETHRRAIEKMLAKQASNLPVAPWIESIRGFGIGSLAAIVGEAGDLSNYSNPAKLWKRMGLAVMPDGQRQRRFADKDMAIAAGYSPSRRSVVWNIGDCLIKANSPQYRPVYDARKEYELTRTDKPIVAHARAKRYMEKRLLLDLWKAWRAAMVRTSPLEKVSPANLQIAAE